MTCSWVAALSSTMHRSSQGKVLLSLFFSLSASLPVWLLRNKSIGDGGSYLTHFMSVLKSELGNTVRAECQDPLETVCVLWVIHCESVFFSRLIYHLWDYMIHIKSDFTPSKCTAWNVFLRCFCIFNTDKSELVAHPSITNVKLWLILTLCFFGLRCMKPLSV